MPFIAILDDQSTNRAIFARLARGIADDVTVETYPDPPTALAALKTRIPDLVITDFKMPGMDGAEFVRHFRLIAGAEDVPVIVLTVYEERSFRMRALENGATDFLQSPVDHQEFVTRARNLLKIRRQQLLLAARAENLQEELAASERTRAEAVRDSRERLTQVIDGIPAMVRCADLEGRLLFANAFHAGFLGLGLDGMVGRPVADFIGEEQGARSNALDRMVWETGRSVPSFEEEIVDPNGQRRVFLSSKAPLIDAGGQVSGILTSSIDITDRKEAENHLRHMAHHDALTDLANRTLLGIRISREIARVRRGGRPFALHLIDIDKFSDINELFGYDAGDVVLVEIAARLKGLARRFDTVARTGGNEFAVLQTQVESSDDALQFAGRLMDTIAQPFAANGETIVATACVGVTVALQDGDNSALLFKNADTALRRAKGEGSGRRALFASDMRARSIADARLDNELRLALEDNQFRLFFQPQVKAATGEIVGAEALVRWERPGAGLQGPGVFLPRAELTGFIVKINEWVLMEACRAAQGWRKLGLPRLRIGVNMSAVQFSRQNVPLLVARALGESGLDPSLLDLELTESSVLEDSEALIHDLSQIQQLGCEISIDDFGTGYSSLRYVKRFPVDRLKIDQSFVRNLPTDPNDVAIVRTILTLGHSLGLEVIAEGVETEEQRDFLVTEGCEEAQGYLFAKPMPHDAFVNFVAGRRPVAMTA